MAYYPIFEDTPSYTLVPVAGATGLTDIFVTITELTPGSQHTYVIRAYDSAGNASSIGYQQVSVYNPVPSPATQAGPVLMEGGGFQFTAEISFAQTTFVQATTNPADSASWVTIATSPPAASFTVSDPKAGEFQMRFYRIVSP